MRAIVWVLLVILAPSVLLIGVLAFIGLMRRFQIARTRRELERLGFVVSLPYAPETRHDLAAFGSRVRRIGRVDHHDVGAHRRTIGSNAGIRCRFVVPGGADRRYRRPARYGPRLRAPRIAASDGVGRRESRRISGLVGVTGGRCGKRRRGAVGRNRSPDVGNGDPAGVGAGQRCGQL